MDIEVVEELKAKGWGGRGSVSAEGGDHFLILHRQLRTIEFCTALHKGCLCIAAT